MQVLKTNFFDSLKGPICKKRLNNSNISKFRKTVYPLINVTILTLIHEKYQIVCGCWIHARQQIISFGYNMQNFTWMILRQRHSLGNPHKLDNLLINESSLISNPLFGFQVNPNPYPIPECILMHSEQTAKIPCRVIFLLRKPKIIQFPPWGLDRVGLIKFEMELDCAV